MSTWIQIPCNVYHFEGVQQCRSGLYYYERMVTQANNAKTCAIRKQHQIVPSLQTMASTSPGTHLAFHTQFALQDRVAKGSPNPNSTEQMPKMPVGIR